MIDFKVIHKTIKDRITLKGFKYLTSDMWFNFELGIFPAATHNNGYTIKPSTGRKSESYEADDWHESPWIIEFCLSGVNDTYLSKIGKCLDAIRSLEGMTASHIAEVELSDWNIQNYDKHVILTFGIMLTLNE